MEIKRTNYIKIQDGCSQKCGYCVVREFRGPSYSESYEDISDEVKYCVEQCGMKVLQLEGVNSIEYFHESVGDIVDLCKRLLKDFPDTYFMVGQINPFDVNRFTRLMDLIGSEPHMIKTCLVPIQSGSNTALARMHRPHTQETLRKLFEHARKCGVEYTIEIIPGFPGETEEEFMDTYNFLDEVSPVAFYTHAFSRRPGTEAASLPNQIPEDVIIERMEKYKELQKTTSERFKKTLDGKKCVLVNEPQHGIRTVHNISIKNKSGKEITESIFESIVHYKDSELYID